MKSALTNYLKASLLTLTAFFLTACGESKERHQPSTPVIPYIRLSAEAVTLTRTLPGRVSAFTVSEVRPQVTGIIKERLFEEGADVVAGQALYQIDPVLYEAAYNNAKAELARIQADENAARLLERRFAHLVKTGAVGKQDYDDALAAYNRIRAHIEAAGEALETARINLSYTKVAAPVSGRIGRSFVTPGALVTQNQTSPLVTIQRISPVYVDVAQPSAELLRLRRDIAMGNLRNDPKNAGNVKLYLEDGTPYTRLPIKAGETPEWIEGEFLFSDITVEQSTGVVNIRAKFNNPEGILLPGMYVKAEIEEGILDNALLVPQKSVTRDLRNLPQVFVLTKRMEAGKAVESAALGEQEYYIEARGVTIERDYGNKWLVMDGLIPGELIAVDGLLHMRPGMVVSGKETAPSTTMHDSGKNPGLARR
ncbi:MAG: efflux RND transporter periplasmic adaptor subunit [Desulfovibrio sp.]|nr:efflux RND transporter periplasmic adaptor subunit [Desulfovibrio sp.]